MHFKILFILAVTLYSVGTQAACQRVPLAGDKAAFLQVVEQRMAATHGVLMKKRETMVYRGEALDDMEWYDFGDDFDATLVVYLPFGSHFGISANMTEQQRQFLHTLTVVTVAYFAKQPESAIKPRLESLLRKGKRPDLTAEELEKDLAEREKGRQGKSIVAKDNWGKVQVEVHAPVLGIGNVQIKGISCK